MKKNVASQSIGAQMITASDGSDFTGAVSVEVTIDNGTQTSGGGTAPAHEGNGYHSYTPTQAETNGDHVAFTFTGTGAITATVQVFTAFPQTGDNYVRLGAPAGASVSADIAAVPTVSEFNARTLAAADYFDPSADTVANVTTVGTCTTNTDMRGTDGANTTTPPTAVQNRQEMDSNSTQLGAILSDTNELQTDDVPGLIAALNDISTTQVNTEVLDVMSVDTFSQPGQGTPPATTTIVTMLSYTYKNLRNKKDQTSTTWQLYNDDTTTVDQKSTVSDDGTTVTKNELITGP